MKPVATRGITISMGMKKPAKGMKSKKLSGKKNRMSKMVIRRTTVTSKQILLPIKAPTRSLTSIACTKKPFPSMALVNFAETISDNSEAVSQRSEISLNW